MKIITKYEKDKGKILKSIFDLLNKNKLLTLSTSYKNKPYSNTCYYAYDKEFNLYFWSEKNALHSKNILRNKKIAVNIFNSNQKWGSNLQGIQGLGKAFVVNNKELIKGGFLYIKRYPKVLKFVKNLKDFHSNKFASRIYKIELEKIKLFDERTFGKDEFREIIIKK